MSDRALRAGVALVALAGVAVAGYLTYVHYQPEALICTAGGGCETVQESSYAELLGIPVALLGLLAYVAVLALVVWDSELARTRRRCGNFSYNTWIAVPVKSMVRN